MEPIPLLGWATCKDGIPALTDPDLIEPGNANYLEEDEMVLGYVTGNEARAYPH